MGNRMVRGLVIAGIAVAAAGVGAAARARTQTPPDVLGALLVEVRALRVAMERMASAGPRIELALGRLQLQEQRVNTLLRRHTDVRERVASLDRDAGIIMRDVERVQELSQNASNEGHRRDIERELAPSKEQYVQIAADLQRLRAEEADVAQMLFAEQSRWTEINQRLEEVERALTSR